MARMTVQSTYLLLSLAYFVMPTVTWFFFGGGASLFTCGSRGACSLLRASP